MFLLVTLVSITAVISVLVTLRIHDLNKKMVESVDRLFVDAGSEPPHKEAARPVQEPSVSYIHEPMSKKASAPHDKAERAEDHVNRLLSSLGPQYIIFTNLIVDKPGYIKTTEIDHLVISPYGIFCIETKSHSGNIYGSVAKKEWKQYLRNKAYSFYNPMFQNTNHVKALGLILGEKLRSVVHRYVVFPYAHIVKVNSPYVFKDTEEIITAINLHKRVIYNRQDLHDIAYALAKYTKEYEVRRDGHVEGVRRYVGSTK